MVLVLTKFSFEESVIIVACSNMANFNLLFNVYLSLSGDVIVVAVNGHWSH